jgi:phosphoglucosamine mutase
MKIFGTDGIRGKYGSFPITKEDVFYLGQSLVEVLRIKDDAIFFIISNDGRESGIFLQDALSSGIRKVGGEVTLVGINPTPIVGYATKCINEMLIVEHCPTVGPKMISCFGVQITASHNPFSDNGIKIFNSNGQKISAELESKIEACFSKLKNLDQPKYVRKFRSPEMKSTGEVMGLERPWNEIFDNAMSPSRMYKNMLLHIFDNELNISSQEKKIKIMIDCANGAYSPYIESMFNLFPNYIVVPIYNKPNGVNINLSCGATKPEVLKEELIQYNKSNKDQVDFGASYDGDGDRVIFITKKGNIVNGDQILFIFSKYLKEVENYNGAVVGTSMTNFGIQKAYDEIGINLIKTDVGDKYVLEKMKEIHSIIGGESSGHIIFNHLDYYLYTEEAIHGKEDPYPIGDSLLTTLYLLKIMNYYKNNISLDDMIESIPITPSRLFNQKVINKTEFLSDKHNKKVFATLVNEIEGNGRILIRPSGTENLIRVLIEHRDVNKIDELEMYFYDNIKQK